MEIKKVKYVEPAEYIPKELRKEYKLGEYAEPKANAKKEAKDGGKEAKDAKKSKK